MTDQFNFSFSINLRQSMIMNLYHNMGPFVLNYSNKEYIDPIKYHRVLSHCSLALVLSLHSLLLPPVTV